MPSIEIYVNEQGEVCVNAKGFQGRGCMDATKPFEDAFGTVTKRSPKPELNSVKTGVTSLGRQHIIKR